MPFFSSESERQAARWRFMTDIIYAARDILGYDKIVERVHRPVADFYGALNPRPWMDGQMSQQDCWQHQSAIKIDIHLDPRGSFKSTLKMVRTIQEIVCFPDITIAYISAASNLPKGFVNSIQDRFVWIKDREPSKFQELFPEYCFPSSQWREGYFTTPMRNGVGIVEPTISATSIESSLSGLHPWKMVFDDVIDNRNTTNPGTMRRVNDNIDLSSYLETDWTYVSFSGTRYSPIDAYAQLLKANNITTMRVLCRAAWTVKPGRENIPLDQLEEKDVDLLFPEIMGWAKLKRKLDKNPQLFCAQMLNDPMGAQNATFEPARFKAAVMDHTQMPVTGPVYIAWRMPYKVGQFNAAGVVGMLDGNRMCVLDVERGVWKPSRLAFKVVETAKKWGTRQIQIEEVPGARAMEEAIKAQAVTQRWPLDIRWTEFQQDEIERAQQVKRLEPLVNARRLVFSRDIRQLDQVEEQFLQFGMQEECEIADAVARVALAIPKIDALQPARASEDSFDKLRQQDRINRLYNLGVYAQPAVAPPKPNPYGLEDIMPGLNG